MRIASGIVEVDLHGFTKEQARVALDAALKRADLSVYVLHVIHGYHGGTELRDFVRKHYKNHEKIKRVETGLNQGTTDLILRDLF